MKDRVFLTAAAFGLTMLAGQTATAQLTTQDTTMGLTATDLVNTLIGAPDVIISNVTLTGAGACAGTFGGGISAGIGLESGVVLSSGCIANAIGPNLQDGITCSHGNPGDVDLDTLATFPTFDACVLEFDFECENLQVISFNYVFASDEYNEFVNTSFNDVFGFFVNGVNIALLPDNVTPVAINNVNCNNPYNPPTGANCNFFINNDLQDGGGALNTEADGLTVVFTATTNVNPGVNHIKLAIGDAGDGILDSWVFLEEGSFTCTPPAPPVDLDIKPGSCPNSFNRNSNGVLPVGLLGTDDFDVNDVDISSILISRTDGIGGSVGPHEGPPGPHTVVSDVGTPFAEEEECDCHEETGDGIPDLNMKFKTQDVVAALELNDLSPGSLVSLTVSGTLNDGTPFMASDCIRLVPPGTPPGMMSVQTGTQGAWVNAFPLDLQLDGGGFGAFERTYPLGTVTLVTAEATYDSRPFVGWKIDGQMVRTSNLTLPLLIYSKEVKIEAIYDDVDDPGSTPTAPDSQGPSPDDLTPQ